MPRESVSQLIVTRNIDVPSSNWSSGTPGTRAYQWTTNIAKDGYSVIAVTFVYVKDSNSYIPVAFTSSTTLYVNFYRAQPAAFTGNQLEATVCVVYAKKQQ